MRITWKLRMAAAQREVWTGAQLRRLLAEKAGLEMSSASVSALFTKQPNQIKLSTLIALCTALECTPNDLFDVDTTPVAQPVTPTSTKVAVERLTAVAAGGRCRRSEDDASDPGLPAVWAARSAIPSVTCALAAIGRAPTPRTNSPALLRADRVLRQGTGVACDARQRVPDLRRAGVVRRPRPLQGVCSAGPSGGQQHRVPTLRKHRVLRPDRLVRIVLTPWSAAEPGRSLH